MKPEMLGGMQYPFASRLGPNMSISTFKYMDEADKIFLEHHQDGLMWVKDDQVNVLSVPGMNAEDIIKALHWDISFKKGPAVASKRISRILRPYRYGYEGKAGDITIWEDDGKSAKVWDGIFQISRRLVMMNTQYLTGLTPKKLRSFENELTHGMRWELTIMTRNGQYKGHAEVVDLPDGVDVVCPVGVAKQEVKLTDDSLFIGLNAVHGAKQMRLDIQSLINLLPFFGTERLIDWLKHSTKHVLHAIKNNDTNALANMLFVLDSAEAVYRMSFWPAGEYLVSGGEVKWFSRAVRTAADQYREQLRSQSEQLRFPVPGGGLYIAPASVSNRTVDRGHALLNFDTASIYINDADWPAFAARNGGFDGDDRHWVVVFNDTLDGKLKALYWRSPNQFGEYLLSELQPGSDIITWIDGTIPTLDSRNLPTPIEQQGNVYGSIEVVSHPELFSPVYSAQAVEAAIAEYTKNVGVLGQFCNICMVHTALRYVSPIHLPAKLEDVIDFTVKEIGDLSGVKTWIREVADELSAYPIPRVLAPRIQGLVTSELGFTDGEHDLDKLVEAMGQTIEWFNAEATAIAATAIPPITIFDAGYDWMKPASELKSIYGKAMRDVVTERIPTKQDLEDIEKLVRVALNKYPVIDHSNMMYGLASYIYTVNAHDSDTIRDGVLWNSVGPDFIEALRKLGLIGDIVWTGKKAELYYNNPPLGVLQPIPAYMKQVWYNLYVATTGDHRPMGEIRKPLQKQYKAVVRDMIPNLIGMKVALVESAKLEDRKVFLGPKGNEMAYLSASQDLPTGSYEILSAIEHDGNLYATLIPEGSG